MSYLVPPKNPNAPIAPTEYRFEYQNQLNGVNRLYFNQIDNGLGALYAPNGGSYLSFPHIAASDANDQYATASDTPTVVSWSSLDSGSGFTLNAPGSATALSNGVFKITYSAQIANTANDIHDAIFWLRINGVDVANSATYFSVPARKSSGAPTYMCAYSEAPFVATVGDVVELVWATNQAYEPVTPTDGVYLFADPAQVLPYERPAIPSVIGSIVFVCNVTA